MTIESITSRQEDQIVRLAEDAARKAAREALAREGFFKETAQAAFIERGDEFQAALVPAFTETIERVLLEKAELFQIKKTNILIKAGGSNPYFDQQLDYWIWLWQTKLGIKNPNLAGIVPFVEHAGYRPLILPKNELITPQYVFDRSRERFGCWKWCSYSLDNVINKNDRDPRAGAYVAWFRDRVESDEDLANISAVELKEKMIPGIILLEREIMEYDHFERTNSHLDRDNVTYCTGSRFIHGSVPGVRWLDNEMVVYECHQRAEEDRLRSRQLFTF